MNKFITFFAMFFVLSSVASAKSPSLSLTVENQQSCFSEHFSLDCECSVPYSGYEDGKERWRGANLRAEKVCQSLGANFTKGSFTVDGKPERDITSTEVLRTLKNPIDRLAGTTYNYKCKTQIKVKCD